MEGFGIDIPINPRLLAIVREFERTRDNPAYIRKLEAMLADGEDFYLVHWSLAEATDREGRVEDALAEGLAAVELDPGYRENYSLSARGTNWGTTRRRWKLTAVRAGP